MSDTSTKDRLDQFASQPLPGGEIVPMATYMPPAERHGAIKVEVTRSMASTRAAISEAASLLGERGLYRWPVKDKGATTWVEGVSIKGAMALLKAFRNCRVSCPLIVDQGTHWRFHAVFVDYENGIEFERSFRQRKTAGRMGDAERREDMSYQIGLSKALRNVVVNYLEIEAEILQEECRNSIIGTVKGKLEFYRDKIASRAKEQHIDLARIEAVIGRPAKNWLAPDMVEIIGMLSYINDGMATADETFPPIGSSPAEERQMVESDLDRFAKVMVQEGGTGASFRSEAADAQPPQNDPPPQTSAAALIQEMMAKVLHIATDPALDTDERLQVLVGAQDHWEDTLPHHRDIVATAFRTAASVVKGTLLADSARKYLDGLNKEETT